LLLQTSSQPGIVDLTGIIAVSDYKFESAYDQITGVLIENTGELFKVRASAHANLAMCSY